MDTDTWQRRIRAMSEERSWTGYHSPKNLTMALSVEVAELVELFQWLTEDESRAVMTDPDRAAAVRAEVADVMTYLLRLVDVLGIDLDEALATKLAESERRYPVGSLPSGLGEGVDAPAVEPLAVTRPVLGVGTCAGGWVGVLLEPGAPRPRVLVASTLATLVEMVRESVEPAVVAVSPGSRAAAAADRPGLRLTRTTGAPFASLEELTGSGMAAPSVLSGRGYAAEDVLAACAAAAEVLRPPR